MAFNRASGAVAFAVVLFHPSVSVRLTNVDDARGRVTQEPVSPHELLPVGVLETVESARTDERYAQIAKDVTGLIDTLSSACTSSTCDDGEYAGCLLRMAGHDFMDFKDGKGGSDGCVDWNDPDNNGLKECLVGGRNGGAELKTVWENHKDEVSLADFLVIAAEAAMVRQRGELKPALDFHKRFEWGRVTNTDCRGQAHLPNPDDGCEAVKKVFGEQLGLSARSSAALMGVHTLGRARLTNSGFDGWWSDPHNSRVFNNNFYVSMLLKGWAPTETLEGKFQWGRVGARQSERVQTQNHPEMMLNTDICLAFGDKAQFAKTQTCCAWVMPDAFPGNDSQKAMKMLKEQEKNTQDFYCGFEFPAERILDEPFGNVKHWCCSMGAKRGPETDCGDPSKLEGMAAKDVMEFAVSEEKWIEAFSEAWAWVTQPATTSPTTTTSPARNQGRGGRGQARGGRR